MGCLRIRRESSGSELIASYVAATPALQPGEAVVEKRLMGPKRTASDG